MKSMILKDLYNICHNIKSMLLLSLVFVFILIPAGEPLSYVVTNTILYSMMIMTTFSFDENCKWERYAMIMPVSRKHYVLAKFMTLGIFCGFGVLRGLIFGVAGGIVFGRFDASVGEELLALLGGSVFGFFIAMFFGGLSIPLLFKFGAEKSRMLSFVAFVIPAFMIMGILAAMSFFGIEITRGFLAAVMIGLPVFILAVLAALYRVSSHIFTAKEL